MLRNIQLETRPDLEAFVMMNDLPIRSQFKKLVTSKTFRSKKKRFEELVDNFNQEDLNHILEGEVSFKITDLAKGVVHRKVG